MTYTKNVRIKNLTIFGLDGSKIAVLGDNITTLMSIDYYESIFEPNFVFEIRFITIENALSDLRLRGTERVNIEIEHQSGTLEFDDLVLNSFVLDSSESTASVFRIQCVPVDVINNEKNRLVQRYDPKVKTSTHVENILKSKLRVDDDMLDIEETANSDGFYGNYWRPHKGIYLSLIHI